MCLLEIVTSILDTRSTVGIMSRTLIARVLSMSLRQGAPSLWVVLRLRTLYQTVM